MRSYSICGYIASVCIVAETPWSGVATQRMEPEQLQLPHSGKPLL